MVLKWDNKQRSKQKQTRKLKRDWNKVKNKYDLPIAQFSTIANENTLVANLGEYLLTAVRPIITLQEDDWGLSPESTATTVSP